jgi:phage baseplate assembly protein gpV
MRGAIAASKIRGVRLAIVVDNKDGDGNPGYRVKVVLPWLNEQDTTYWMRIAVPMGGPDRGTYVLPEIGDQVLVVFEHGDINRPIMIGALWSSKQEPVEVNRTGKNNTKLIKSRCGHRIIFNDAEGAESITIVDSTRKNKIVLDSANNAVQIQSSGDIEVIAKANVILHANALKVGASEALQGKGASLLAHSVKTFGLKASSGITVGGGNTTINLSNAAACRVAGSGAGELGGVAVETPRDQVEPSDSARRHASTGRGGAGASSVPPGSQQSRTAGTPAQGRDDEVPDAPVVEPSSDFIEFGLVDSDGQPVAFARYAVIGSDGAKFSGKLGADGHARVEGIASGDCTVTFPDPPPAAPRTLAASGGR